MTLQLFITLKTYSFTLLIWTQGGDVTATQRASARVSSRGTSEHMPRPVPGTDASPGTHLTHTQALQKNFFPSVMLLLKFWEN